MIYEVIIILSIDLALNFRTWIGPRPFDVGEHLSVDLWGHFLPDLDL